jgi:SAM-dependent methyltransferase
VDALPYLPPAALAAHGPLTAHSVVLDVGCLSGYGLCDLLLRQRLAGGPCPRLLALDICHAYLVLLRQLAGYWQQDVPLLALRGDLTALPVQRAAVDLLVARLVLPYVSLPQALAEIARVVRPGGSVLLQLHGSGYYRGQAWRTRYQPLRCAYYLRPLASGLWFRLTGRQPRHRLFAETAMGVPHLTRAAAPYGLTLAWQGPPAPKPLLLLRRA